ncbi:MULTISPECIES: hypothetical protein [unclassified Enterococcus]|uniref:hypothetical protein n=1 Tax=unclassified Enterococcus TaxID=2608891 RepID=UPI001CE1A5C1|nr:MULTISPECIES: hypothetical protein [unclassified Enterococcus]MCA5013558.1 hypothetical protein [Enterococcus sp. S23]MCA5016808.1 hypothetical protein [Enterococcus sp. S22(2020)]
MTILDGLFIGILSTAILCMIFASAFFVSSFFIRKKIKQLEQRRPKSKKKRKFLKKKIFKLRKRRKKRLRSGLILFMLGGLLAGGTVFSRYHQATNLSDRDSDGIVEGYFLLNKTEQQLAAVKETTNKEKTSKNLRELAAKLSGFGVRYADPRLTLEGQKLLNRYYSQMKELGLNLNNQSAESLQEKTIYDDYVADIKKVQATQKKIFVYFNVNESALEQKK